MLTAKSEESDIVLGLNLGADDYVTKPFSIRQLLARASALLRRTKQQGPAVYSFGPYVLDIQAMRLTCNGNDVVLSPKEFRLLEFFVTHAGRALTRDQILNAVWGYDSPSGPRCVDRFVTTLRQKVEPDPIEAYLHTYHP
jgi:DNA-binding response OmpR family regulator